MLTVLKIAWYWQKYRYMNQYNSIESPEIYSYTMDSKSLTRKKNIQWGKDSFFSKQLEKLDSHM